MATLLELFGDFTPLWPSHVIKQMRGVDIDEDHVIQTWLDKLILGVELKDIRTGVFDGLPGLEATASLDNSIAPSGTGFVDGFPVVFKAMPDVLFRLQDTDKIKLVVTMTPGGPHVLLENLDVIIELPDGMIQPPESHLPSQATAQHKIGKVTYGRGFPTEIETKVRISVDTDLNVKLTTPTPISFQECLFLEAIPVKGIHDFVLIPSPNVAQEYLNWLRHSIEPFVDSGINGMFGVRSILLDSTVAPLKSIAEWLNKRSENEPMAEFVLDDLVFPFFSIPIPRHITVGIRKLFLTEEQIKDPKEYFDFDRAPVITYFNEDPIIALFLKSLFYRSQPISDIEEKLGLTFSGGMAFGGERLDPATAGTEDEPPLESHVAKIGLGEQYTLFLGYQWPEALNLFEIAGLGLYAVGIRLGYSIGRHIELKDKGQEDGDAFAKSLYIVGDFMVTKTTGDGTSDNLIDIRGMNSDEVKFIIEGIGYDRGNFAIQEKISIPDGMALWFANTVALVLEEIGLLAEQGATYFSISGGVLWKCSFEGGITFKRLRFRISGNPNAPAFKMDGFYILLKNGDSFIIEAAGYYTEDTKPTLVKKEFGLAGKVGFKVGSSEYAVGLDLIIGSIDFVDPAEDDFKYFMLQVSLQITINVTTVEFYSVKVLLANNMQPKLKEYDKDSRDLRYYTWYTTSGDPLRVNADRRLAAWKPMNDAWAVGIGASVSIAGMGSVFRLAAFVMVIDGPDEKGFMIAAELFLLGSKKPLAYAVIEYDSANGKFSAVIGVDIKVSTFVQNVPDWLNAIAKISGTLFFSNKPATVALGRLSDERTWFGLELNYNVWISSARFKFALCFEYVDGEVLGFGLIVRLEGGADVWVLEIKFNVGFGFLVGWFKTGSVDYAVAIWVEGGFRFVVFKFLRFGISSKLDLRIIGEEPSRTELTGEFRFETPWFLPDITWGIECVWGDASIEDLSAAVAPLMAASATTFLKKNHDLHLETPDITWDGQGPRPTHSIKTLRSYSASESARLSRFESNENVRPVPTDSTITIDWSVPVTDRVLPGPLHAQTFGVQETGELTLTYDFTNIEIRRRNRFGTSRPWETVDSQKELSTDFSDAEGVELEGFFGPSNISKVWDPGKTIAGDPIPKSLRLNAKTPYEFVTKDPETDEEIIRNNSGWPCCDPYRRKKDQPKYHLLRYIEHFLGEDVTGDQLFTESLSIWRFMADQAYVRIRSLGSNIPDESKVAHVSDLNSGIIATVIFDEDVAYILLSMAWIMYEAQFRIVLYDKYSEQTKSIDLASNSQEFEYITLGAPFPIRRMELHFINTLQNSSATTGRFNFRLELFYARYVSLKDWLDFSSQEESCSDSSHHDGYDPYQGNGKLNFLPNHEYEIAITSRIGILSASEEPAPAEITEYVYFKTKGLPGLNAVERTGEEIEPYVASTYQGGRGLVYREEPVAIAFQEDFHVAVPLAARPDNVIEEHTALMQMHLLVSPDVAAFEDTVFTTTTPDWIVENRKDIITPISGRWKASLSDSKTVATKMISLDPGITRLAVITQRDEVTCDLPDPSNADSCVLVAHPPEVNGQRLWAAQQTFTGYVRKRDSAFVDRRSFVAADLTALKYYTDSTIMPDIPWRINEDAIVSDTVSRTYGVLGMNTWNHMEIILSLDVNSGTGGLGLALPGSGTPSRGLFVEVRRSGNSYDVVLIRRSSGAASDQDISTMTVAAGDMPAILRVFSYDDKLRVYAGEQNIEMDRDDMRDGCLALFTQGDCRFHQLTVQGITMYNFPFSVSRFTSFTSHIQSFDSQVDVVENDTMGESAVVNVSTLLTDTRIDIMKAMEPEASDLKRQEVFDVWQQALQFPLKDELNNLELSRYNIAGQTACFILESPEPLDFTEEVSLKLAAQQKIYNLLSIDSLGDFNLADRLRLEDRQLLLNKKVLDRRVLNKRLFKNPQKTGAFNPSLLKGKKDKTDKLREIKILEFTPAKGRNKINIKLRLPSDFTSADISNLLFIKRGKGKGRRTDLTIYKSIPPKTQDITIDRPMKIDPALGRLLIKDIVSIQAIKNDTDIISITDRNTYDTLIKVPEDTLMVYHLEAGLLSGVNVTYTYEPVSTLILQSGNRQAALIIPEISGVHQLISGGNYRLTFSIDRKRWDTTSAMDSDNTYKQNSSIEISI